MTRNPAKPSLEANIDHDTVRGFGEEWSEFDQIALRGEEYERLFQAYFAIFPFDQLPQNAEGFDVGCGSGRWAAGVVDRVGQLHCIDPSESALAVARRRLGDNPKVCFHLASVDNIPLPDGSQDFGYSLGVLHHVPDTSRALVDCVRKLKIGSPFLLYLYYRLDGRPLWFRTIWRLSDWVRRGVCRLPIWGRRAITDLIALLVYWPLARSSALLERFGVSVSNLPLSAYRHCSFYTMRTDALDRFGTPLEQRFTRDEVTSIMEQAGLAEIRFSEREPYWVACGKRAR